MKADRTGVLMVAGAALALYLVVKKSTGTAKAGAPSTAGQGGIGANASSFWGNVINNLAGAPAAATGTGATGIGQPLAGGVTLFGNGTFDASGLYVDPGQVTVNTNTGAVQESPFSGMYNILSPGTYGF